MANIQFTPEEHEQIVAQVQERNGLPWDLVNVTVNNNFQLVLHFALPISDTVSVYTTTLASDIPRLMNPFIFSGAAGSVEGLIKDLHYSHVAPRPVHPKSKKGTK